MAENQKENPLVRFKHSREDNIIVDLEALTQIFRKNIKEIYHWQDVGLSGRIILKHILKTDREVWAGLMWVSTGTSRGLLRAY